MEQGEEGELTVARVSLQNKLSALIPTDVPEPVPSEDQPVLRVVPAAPAVEEVAAESTDAEPTAQRTTDAAPAKRIKNSSPTPRTKAPRPQAAVPRVEVGQDVASKGVGVLLPKSLDARLRAHHDTTKKSFPTILMDAVEATYDRLPAHIAKATGRDKEAPKSSLFGRTTGAQRRVLDSDEGTIRHTIRLSERNLGVLDDITADMHAPSRTFLIVTALDAYLPPTD